MTLRPNELIQRIRQMGVITPEKEQEARRTILMSLLSPTEIMRLQEALRLLVLFSKKERKSAEPADYDFILIGLGLTDP